MASFLGEIKRRKVFQVAAAYAVVAWLLVQVITSVEQPLNLPDWFDTAVIVMLGIGFPIAVIVAWAFDLTPTTSRPADEIAPPGPTAALGGQRTGFVMQVLVLVAVAFLVLDQYLLDEPAEPLANRASSATGEGVVRRLSVIFDNTDGVGDTGMDAHIAISPDGRNLVYAANVDGIDRLYLRPLDQLEATPILGTEGAHHPCFSKDGQSVAFFTDSTDHKLKIARLFRGQVEEITDSEFAPGCTWARNGDFAYSLRDQSLRLIGLEGDGPSVLGGTDSGEYAIWPEFLPDDQSILFAVRGVGVEAREGRIDILSLETGEARTLIENAHRPKYSPSGHILFARGSNLWAVPFDIASLEIMGPEALLKDQVQAQGNIGASAFDIAEDGTLVYVPGTDSWDFEAVDLVWVTRDGVEEAINLPPRVYFAGSLSPDDTRFAVEVDELGNSDIWVYDLQRGSSDRLTSNPADDIFPLWTLDGEHIVFGSNRGDTPGLHIKAANGLGPVQRLTSSANLFQHVPESFTPDGRFLVFRERIGGLSDLYLLSMDDRTFTPLLVDSTLDTDRAAISPDGDWIAYTSNEAGQYEVYVQSFPDVGTGERFPISIGGGHAPIWSRDGAELFYRNGPDVLTVPIDSSSGFAPGNPRLLFSDDYQYFENCCGAYDVAASGQQFLMWKSEQQTEQRGVPQIVVVENWFDDLVRLAPPTDSR